MGISFGISCKVGEIPHFTTLPRKHKKRAEGCPPLFSQRLHGAGSTRRAAGSGEPRNVGFRASPSRGCFISVR